MIGVDSHADFFLSDESAHRQVSMDTMGDSLSHVVEPPRKGLRIAYSVVAVLLALMMSISATGKLTQNPGAVKVIHERVGIPLGLFPVLAALLIAGGIGLVVGIFRPKVGLAAATGLVVYFTCAMLSHVFVGDFAGLAAPIVPFLLSITVLILRSRSMPAPA